MEGTRRSESTSVAIHTCKTLSQEQCEGRADTAGADTDCDHNLLVAKMCTRLKKIIRFQKRRAKWGLE